MAVDIGTTGIKVCIFDKVGKRLAHAYREHPLICKKAGWAEQDPNEWWEAFKYCMKLILRNNRDILANVAAISCTGQIATPVMLDSEGSVICNSPIWMDRRAQEQCESFCHKFGFDRLYNLTGLRPDPMFTLYKLLWIKEKQPENYQKIKIILQPKDYFNYRLTGIMATDTTIAASTQMFDIANLVWNIEIFEAVDISPKIMPVVYKSTHVLGKVHESLAIEFGIMPEAIVVAGSGDSTASTLGCGVCENGRAAIVLGTASDVSLCSDKPILDPGKRIGCYPFIADGTYMAIAGSNSSPVALKWFRDQFYESEKVACKQANIDIYDYMMNAAAEIEAGAKGLIFLPYLSGERSPIYNVNARGIFAGISLVHERGHFIRAILEGVGMSVKDRVNIFTDIGTKLYDAVLTGGGAKSELWREIITDMLGQPTYYADEPETTCLGAAMIAAYSVGIYGSIQKACKGMEPSVSKILPDTGKFDFYNKLFTYYKELYNNNLNLLGKLSHM